MDAELVDTQKKVLAGISFYGDPFSASAGWTEENEIGRLWDRFMRLHAERRSELPETSRPDTMYEVHIWDKLTQETGHYEVFVGYETVDFMGLPPFLLAKVLPAACVARFTLHGQAISDYDSYLEMDDWISHNGLRRAGTWLYNLYDKRYKGIDHLDQSTIDVCIPTEPA